MLEVKLNKYGRGVYATQDIPKNTILTIDDLLVLNYDKEEPTTTVKKYIFQYSKNCYAFCLGRGSLFNHSCFDSNVDWNIKRNKKLPKIEFYTLRKISKGEELFINYGQNISDYL